MNEHEPPAASPFYRVDKFAVPAEGRAEFLERVASTHALLRTQKGFVRDLILEQQSGPGALNFVTLVEWTGPEAVECGRGRRRAP
jgi:heme-degrading monooxygenase HmoA